MIVQMIFLRKKYLLTCVFLIVSCLVFALQDFPIAKIVDTVVCRVNRSQSYALYLPEAYRASKKLPILYIFDPLARGSLAVDTFRNAAERYGYILICSNNSRNGSWDSVFTAANAIFADTEERILFDPKRIYVAGFSGGSRAALAIATITDDKICGVIGCGAGFPPVMEFHPTTASRFHYIGLVGHEDMNLLEHQLMPDVFDSLGISNDLFLFPGKHQWPPKNIIEMALLKLRLMDGIEINENWPGRFTKLSYRNARTMLLLGFPHYALQQLTMSRDKSEVRLKKILQLSDSIRVSRSCRKQTRINRRIQDLEKSNMKKYISAFKNIEYHVQGGEFNLQWWMEEINELREISALDKNQAWSHYAARMLNLISARSAETAFRYENLGDYSLVAKFTGIWMYAAPESAHPYWYRAKIYALQKMKQPALEYLEKARHHGMTRSQSLLHPAFADLSDEPAFKKLLNQLQRQEFSIP